MEKNNIIFMGTPDFAVESLKILIKSNYNILGVVTATDKKRGRGKKISFSPIKNFAIKNNIPVHQPKNLKSEEFINLMKKIKPDLFVVVAFRMLPEIIINIPQYGSINLHASLLPNYRGAAPINWVIINGERETGVTIFFINKKIDEGDIISKKKIKINEDETAGSLHDKLMKEGAKLLRDSIKKIFIKNIKREIQKISLKDIKAPKIQKKDCFINLDLDDKNIIQLIKGLSPYPGARIIHNNKVFKIIDAKNINNYIAEIGLNQIEDKIILNNNNKESIQITKIQEEGKKILNVKEYLKGNKL
jgi:methionyl-tRNA formyltransferase|tara:strand:- start:1643 stop:2554 length:912 start_codon:yes stop_codon:yes gene_type:complete